MGRTRPEGSARERLLAAADGLFYSEGINSTGVDALVAEAQVALGSLYNNFGGKDALVVAYLESRDDRWREQWEACIAEQTDPVDRVLAIFTAIERWNRTVTTNRGCAHVAAAIQLNRASPGTAAALSHKTHLGERMQELVAAVGVGDPAQVTQDILMIYEGMFTMLALALDPDPVGRARKLATTLLQ